MTLKMAVAARPGCGQRHDHPHQRRQPRVAVDHRRLLDVARDLGEEALHHPDHEARVQAGVDQNQPEPGVEQTPLGQGDVERDHEQDAGDHAHEQRHHERRLVEPEAHPEPGERVGRQRADRQADGDRDRDDDQAVLQVRPEVVGVEEPRVVARGGVVRVQRDAAEDVDRLLERRVEHPPEREDGDRQDQRDHGVEADPGQAPAHRTVFRSMRTATSISSMTIASRAMSIAAAWPYWVNRNAVL